MKIIYIIIVMSCLAICGYSDSNTLFHTISSGDLPGLSDSELDVVLQNTESEYRSNKVYVSGGSLSFLSEDELRQWNRDVLVWKILNYRLKTYVNERVIERNKPGRAEDYISIDEIYDTIMTNQQEDSIRLPCINKEDGEKKAE